jgi:hypothetical protein
MNPLMKAVMDEAHAYKNFFTEMKKEEFKRYLLRSHLLKNAVKQKIERLSFNKEVEYTKVDFTSLSYVTILETIQESSRDSQREFQEGKLLDALCIMAATNSLLFYSNAYHMAVPQPAFKAFDDALMLLLDKYMENL